MVNITMEFQIEKIFSPSTGVDLVLNLNSLYPVSMSSIIYDIDINAQKFIIAKPLPTVKNKIKYKEMHITTIIRQKNDIKQRVGLKCIPTGSSSKYRLASGKNISVIVLKYFPPVIETNIRSGYRLPLSKNFNAEAEIINGKTKFYSSKDFIIRDISITGMGLIIPKKIKKKVNPLTKLDIHHQAKIKIYLLRNNVDKPVSEIATDFEIKRINTNFNEFNFLMGIQFIKLPTVKEDELNKFIHLAQVDELKRLSGISL